MEEGELGGAGGAAAAPQEAGWRRPKDSGRRHRSRDVRAPLDMSRYGGGFACSTHDVGPTEVPAGAVHEALDQVQSQRCGSTW